MTHNACTLFLGFLFFVTEVWNKGSVIFNPREPTLFKNSVAALRFPSRFRTPGWASSPLCERPQRLPEGTILAGESKPAQPEWPRAAPERRFMHDVSPQHIPSCGSRREGLRHSGHGLRGARATGPSRVAFLPCTLTRSLAHSLAQVGSQEGDQCCGVDWALLLYYYSVQVLEPLSPKQERKQQKLNWRTRISLSFCLVRW